MAFVLAGVLVLLVWRRARASLTAGLAVAPVLLPLLAVPLPGVCGLHRPVAPRRAPGASSRSSWPGWVSVAGACSSCPPSSSLCGGRGPGAAPGGTGGRRAALPDGRGQPAPGPRPVPGARLRGGALPPRSTTRRSSRTTASAARTGRSTRCTRVGLSLLILPAYALGGYPAASFFMALLAALARLARFASWLRAAFGDRAAGRRRGLGRSRCVRRSSHYAGLRLHGGARPRSCSSPCARLAAPPATGARGRRWPSPSCPG